MLKKVLYRNPKKKYHLTKKLKHYLFLLISRLNSSKSNLFSDFDSLFLFEGKKLQLFLKLLAQKHVQKLKDKVQNISQIKLHFTQKMEEDNFHRLYKFDHLL